VIDFFGLLILLLLVVVFGYLTYRAWGSKNAILKWVGLVLSGLVTLLFALVLIVAVLGTLKMNQNYNSTHPVANITVERTPEQIARGEELATTCTGCHGTNGEFPLTGQDFTVGGPPIGVLWSANLTPAGELKDWSDGEIIRAIREGVHKNGRSLFIMPSSIYHHLSDEDVQAIVAYLRTQPPAGAPSPLPSINIVGAILTQLLPIAQSVQPPITQPVPRPPIGLNLEYGQYMMNVAACTDCHGKDFAGGTPAPAGLGPPVGPTIRDLGKRYTEEQFLALLRTGIRSSGQPVSDQMPWRDYRALSDEDLKAMYMYLTSLPPN
jgi:cytochrome c553